MEYITNAMRAP